VAAVASRPVEALRPARRRRREGVEAGQLLVHRVGAQHERPEGRGGAVGHGRLLRARDAADQNQPHPGPKEVLADAPPPWPLETARTWWGTHARPRASRPELIAPSARWLACSRSGPTSRSGSPAGPGAEGHGPLVVLSWWRWSIAADLGGRRRGRVRSRRAPSGDPSSPRRSLAHEEGGPPTVGAGRDHWHYPRWKTRWACTGQRGRAKEAAVSHARSSPTTVDGRSSTSTEGPGNRWGA
jgi:hypothetical protein